jgi:S-adenosylmethionine-diacylgycerolhomoserine-N-methlytransferase
MDTGTHMTGQPQTGADHAGLMDGVYRYQRHLYDVTRKYYLFGRDTLIRELDPPEGGRVLEVGCGTGRNLVLAAEKYPGALFYGIDISSEMLKSARAKAGRSRAGGRIFTGTGDAREFDTGKAFSVPVFDRVFFSYSLSMIPGWEQAVRCALDHVAHGGRLYVVDFGEMEAWPGFARLAMRRWLARFHVHPRAGMAEVLQALAAERGMIAETRKLAGGYAVLSRISRA